MAKGGGQKPKVKTSNPQLVKKLPKLGSDGKRRRRPPAAEFAEEGSGTGDPEESRTAAGFSSSLEGRGSAAPDDDGDADGDGGEGDHASAW